MDVIVVGSQFTSAIALLNVDVMRSRSDGMRLRLIFLRVNWLIVEPCEYPNHLIELISMPIGL